MDKEDYFWKCECEDCDCGTQGRCFQNGCECCISNADTHVNPPKPQGRYLTQGNLHCPVCNRYVPGGGLCNDHKPKPEKGQMTLNLTPSANSAIEGETTS